MPRDWSQHPLDALMSLFQAPQPRQPVRPLEQILAGAQIGSTQKSPYERTLRPGEQRTTDELRDMLGEVILAGGSGLLAAPSRSAPSAKPIRSGVDVLTNEAGEPVRVYHGTSSGGFGKFDSARGGSSSGDPAAREGFFFSSSPGEAAFYARLGGKGGESIMPAYLKMRNPLRVPYKASTRPEVLRNARAAGHDGVIDASGDYVVFEPGQVLSAITGR